MICKIICFDQLKRKNYPKFFGKNFLKKLNILKNKSKILFSLLIFYLQLHNDVKS